MNHSSQVPSPSATCSGCGTTQRFSLIIHNVCYTSHNRHLCTNCLLKNHHGLFCPICYQVYDDSLPLHQRLKCLRCPSVVHRSCALPFSTTTTNASSAPLFLCPTCSDVKFSYFNLSAADRISRTVDEKSFKVLAAASRITAMSMSRGATAARFEAEWLAKEAAMSRKRAMEAMEELADIQENEEEKSHGCVFDLNLDARLHVTEE
ncbi:hypothetical protein TanjilG_29177 [Lupinus angustifolius]|uniref:RING-type domain-containing protein n=1 Tax=Lupinus angustifolius TaxID=3871 RepID=A0A1J7HIC4_LUPAN|nr:PREDICTED: uncharacterized protein LOC109361927 [Lupinus angustifolius]OIW00187.1 hypothetical protein TanjilG_29177 [Lupinus angustifolius]